MKTNLFKQVSSLIAKEDYKSLSEIELGDFTRFNWVKEVFEGIHLVERPNKTALLWTDGVYTINYSFRQLSEEYNKLLNFLRSKGVEQGDMILTQTMLQPTTWISILATIKGGLQMIPTASIMGTKDLAFRFEKTFPKVIISDKDNAYKIDEAETLIGKKIPIKIICDDIREGWYDLSAFAAESIEAEAADTMGDDTLFMFFTSGTTGMPKIVCHTHISAPVGHLTTASWIGVKEDDIHYNISQPGWAKFTWSSVFAPWNVGACIFAYHTLDRFNAATTLKLMEIHKISTLCAPPTVYRVLIQENLKDYNFSLRSCVAAGEPLNPEIIEKWSEGTGITIRDGFGQTESTCLVANHPGQQVKMGSMGMSTFLYNVIIADDEGNELPNNEEGNICVKTNTGKLNGLFKGYLYDKERQAKVFKNGVYFTGDKAYRDEDGYIWFIGRDDDVIKSSDYRVGPFEVESVLLEHDAIIESAVVGSPHPVKGYEIKAFVILAPNFEPSEALAKEIFSFSREHIAPYKMPRIIEFVKELPKTISGKIKRVELRAQEANVKLKEIKNINEFKYVK